MGRAGIEERKNVLQGKNFFHTTLLERSILKVSCLIRTAHAHQVSIMLITAYSTKRFAIHFLRFLVPVFSIDFVSSISVTFGVNKKPIIWLFFIRGTNIFSRCCLIWLFVVVYLRRASYHIVWFQAVKKPRVGRAMHVKLGCATRISSASSRQTRGKKEMIQN